MKTSSNAAEAQERTEPSSTVALACDMSALNATDRKRHSELSYSLFVQHIDIKELENGYSLQFENKPGIFSVISEWVLLERQCCPFLGFSLEISPENRPIRLRLTGHEGTKEFLRAELQPLFARGSKQNEA